MTPSHAELKLCRRGRVRVVRVMKVVRARRAQGRLGPLELVNVYITCIFLSEQPFLAGQTPYQPPMGPPMRGYEDFMNFL